MNQHPAHHNLRTPPLGHQTAFNIQQQPLTIATNQVKQFSYFPYHYDNQLTSSPCSSGTCYSPEARFPLDAPVSEFSGLNHPHSSMDGKSSSAQCFPPKTASPIPLATLAAAAAAEHTQMHGFVASSSNIMISQPPEQPQQKQQQQQQEQQEPQPATARRRGGRKPARGLTAEEKEKRRKVSHSAIEKRRRERTNNVLRELQILIPELGKSSKVQKLEIIEAAAQHIKDLRALCGYPKTASIAESAFARPVAGSPIVASAFDEDNIAEEPEKGEDDDDIEDEANVALQPMDVNQDSGAPSHGSMNVGFLLM
ncbi:hypothetical protein LPJ66_001517 [Kickxella alabastrina]|uniref:Uncharacterized protein n=1 Tax=Kickxella alabastrina TaxID=61397 RepID=A0ACC1IT16_9FUNG|nr:hypothetical protein LPJ66_001517 [Kickxella alabastrina]